MNPVVRSTVGAAVGSSGGKLHDGAGWMQMAITRAVLASFAAFRELSLRAVPGRLLEANLRDTGADPTEAQPLYGSALRSYLCIELLELAARKHTKGATFDAFDGCGSLAVCGCQCDVAKGVAFP